MDKHQKYKRSPNERVRLQSKKIKSRQDFKDVQPNVLDKNNKAEGPNTNVARRHNDEAHLKGKRPSFMEITTDQRWPKNQVPNTPFQKKK